MSNFLKALGQGLRIAGASQSPEHYAQFRQENQFNAQQEEQRRQLILGLAVKARENDSIDDATFAQITKGLGFGGLPDVGIGADVQKLRAQQEKERRIAVRRKEGAAELSAIDTQFDPGNVMTDLPAEGGGPRKDFSDPNAVVSPEHENLTVPEVVGTAKQNELDKPEVRLQLADELDRKAIEYDGEEGMKELADAARARAVVHRARAKELQVLQNPDKETEKEAEIRRWMSIGVSKEEAIKLAYDAYAIASDAQGRDYIWDKVKQRRVTELDSIVRNARKVKEGTGETVDIGQATGASGFAYRALNTIVDFFGGGLVFKDAEKGTNAIEQLRIDIIGVGEAKIPGRPSDFQLRLSDSLAVNPRDIFTGDARALQKFRDTRSYLQREVDRMYDVVLSNPRQYAPRELTETTQNASQMEEVVRQLNWAIDQMERKGKPRKSASELWNEE